MGVLEITHAPWTWCDSVPCWFCIPEETANAGNGWVYPPHHDTLQIVQIDSTDWGYSFALGKWLYLTANGWVYMVRELIIRLSLVLPVIPSCLQFIGCHFPP